MARLGPSKVAMHRPWRQPILLPRKGAISLRSKVQVVSIHKNGNGQTDPEEIYSTKQAAVDAVASGTYPSPPARNLNLASCGPAAMLPPAGPDSLRHRNPSRQRQPVFWFAPTFMRAPALSLWWPAPRVHYYVPRPARTIADWRAARSSLDTEPLRVYNIA